MERKGLLTVIEERIQLLIECGSGSMFFEDGKLKGTEHELQREKVRIMYRVEELITLKDTLVKQQAGLLPLPFGKNKDLPRLAYYAIEMRIEELISFRNNFAIDPPDTRFTLERRDYCEREEMKCTICIRELQRMKGIVLTQY